MKGNTKKNNRHIAMWSCPRSRSTLIARSFEQLDGCIIYDEPLYAPYLLNHALDHPERELVMAHRETGYDKVLQKMTGDLPKGKVFSFQKQMAKHVRLNSEINWLKSLTNFFIIRDPKEIILSYSKVCKIVTKEEIGMEAVYNLFEKLEALTGETPLIVDSTDLIKNPRGYLSLICNKMGIDFSETMLSWEAGLGNAKEDNPFPWLWTGELPPTDWYSNIDSSTGFIPYVEKEVNLPDEQMPVFEECMIFYEKLKRYRQVIA